MQALTLDEYAAVTARLLHAAGAQPEAVLAELGIPPDTWAFTAALWERALDAAIARGDDELLAAFVARFTATRAALARAHAAEASQLAPIAGRLTTAVDRGRLSLPALPFASSPTPPPAQADSARRARILAGLPFTPQPAISAPLPALDIADAPPTVRSPRAHYAIELATPPAASTPTATPAAAPTAAAAAASAVTATAPAVDDAAPDTLRLAAPAPAADAPAATPATAADRRNGPDDNPPILLTQVTRTARRSWLRRLRDWLLGRS